MNDNGLRLQSQMVQKDSKRKNETIIKELEKIKQNNEKNSLMSEIEKGNLGVLDKEVIDYLKSNKSFLLEAIKLNSKVIDYFSELKNDRDFMVEAIAINPILLSENKDVFESNEYIDEAISLNPIVFKYAPAVYQKNPNNIVKLAIASETYDNTSGVKTVNAKDELLDFLPDEHKKIFEDKYSELSKNRDRQKTIDYLVSNPDYDDLRFARKILNSLNSDDELLKQVANSVKNKVTIDYLKDVLKEETKEKLEEYINNNSNSNNPPIVPPTNSDENIIDEQVSDVQLQTQTNMSNSNSNNEPPKNPPVDNISEIDNYLDLNEGLQLQTETKMTRNGGNNNPPTNDTSSKTNGLTSGTYEMLLSDKDEKYGIKYSEIKDKDYLVSVIKDHPEVFNWIDGSLRNDKNFLEKLGRNVSRVKFPNFSEQLTPEQKSAFEKSNTQSNVIIDKKKDDKTIASFQVNSILGEPYNSKEEGMTDLELLDFALETTFEKYGANQVVDALSEHNSIRVTQDDGAREAFDVFDKEEIDKEMMKGALKLVEYQKEQFQNFKENPDNPASYNRFMNVGRELYLAVNEQKDLSDFVNDEEKRKGMAELFTIRYSQPEHKENIDKAIDDKDPRLQQIDNYFNQQLEQNMVNSPKTIH